MRLVLFSLLLPLGAQAVAPTFTIASVCGESLHEKRAKELQSLEAADQADRQGDINKIDWKKVAPRDLERRQKALSIFAEGCFLTAEDYFDAALIFQHGSVPDHVYQAYLWASKAAELKPEQEHFKSLSQAALDRYLMDLGYKQVYATQGSKNPAGCFCLWPVEVSATDQIRVKAGAKTIAEKLLWIGELNRSDPKCGAAVCPNDAKPAVKGALPGVNW